MAFDLLGKCMWNTDSWVEMSTQLNAATTRLGHEGTWCFRWWGGDLNYSDHDSLP